MEIKDTDIHNHLKARMLQRGITVEEIQITINQGEVTVYYKIKDGRKFLLTAKARYGKVFFKGGEGK